MFRITYGLFLHVYSFRNHHAEFESDKTILTCPIVAQGYDLRPDGPTIIVKKLRF